MVAMEPVKVGTVVEMRKPHPCGANRWEVIRYGADVKLKCLGCGHVVMLERPKFQKRLKKVIESGRQDGA